jgi:hypothetical protein
MSSQEDEIAESLEGTEKNTAIMEPVLRERKWEFNYNGKRGWFNFEERNNFQPTHTEGQVMSRKIIISVLGSLLIGCAIQIQRPEEKPVTVSKTVVGESTAEIDPRRIADNEEVAKFTRELFDISSNCQASTFLYDFRSDTILYGYEAGIKSVREKCDLGRIDLELPDHCERCRDLIPVIQEHANLMVAGADMIEEANTTLDQELLNEGLEKFYVAKIYWEDVAEAINGVRIRYNLPEIIRE